MPNHGVTVAPGDGQQTRQRPRHGQGLKRHHGCRFPGRELFFGIGPQPIQVGGVGPPIAYLLLRIHQPGKRLGLIRLQIRRPLQCRQRGFPILLQQQVIAEPPLHLGVLGQEPRRGLVTGQGGIILALLFQHLAQMKVGPSVARP